MHSSLRRCSVLAMLCVLFLGGCSFPWWNTPSSPPADPQNVLLNSDAGDQGLGWAFSDDAAFVRLDSGNPVFAITYFASIHQSVDISSVPGDYMVLLAVTATEAARFCRGAVQSRTFDDSHSEPAGDSLWLRDLSSTADAQGEWLVLAEYAARPVGAAWVDVTLNTIGVTTSPPPPGWKPAPWETPVYNGEQTWFDNVELWIVGTEQEALALIDAYAQEHAPDSQSP